MHDQAYDSDTKIAGKTNGMVALKSGAIGDLLNVYIAMRRTVIELRFYTMISPVIAATSGNKW